MPNNHLGNLRRSSALMTFGPGAIIDFRAEGAPVSAIAAGLESWDALPPRGLAHPQHIIEPRLQKKLGVNGFRLPPVRDELADNQLKDVLGAARFPRWLQCPACDTLATVSNWQSLPGKAGLFCSRCTQKAPGQKKVFVIPVRFVLACEAGHLQDFPWHFWVGHRRDCNERKRLQLTAQTAGLAGLFVSCPKCGSGRSLDGIFGKETWAGFACSGERPWLPVEPEPCTNKPRALQRGASNIYFPIIESALSIPPWSDRLQEAIGVYWSAIANQPEDKRANFITQLAVVPDIAAVLQEFKLTPEDLSVKVSERKRRLENPESLRIRDEEYRQFTSGWDSKREEDENFEVRSTQLPALLKNHLSAIVRVVRLREVRVLKGFTRITPPGDDNPPAMAHLSKQKLDWLPGIDVRGEGIFVSLQEEAVANWEIKPEVNRRTTQVHKAYEKEWRQRYGQGQLPREITTRFLLLHTFAHTLMRQMTLECGYSSASLRERIYASAGSNKMSGLLIYTATGDSDGTLGGLQRQGERGRFERILLASIHAMEWCSSDPLCITGVSSAADNLLLAACHACVLAPETSCEEYNRFLDRALLVGVPDDVSVGFFSGLLR